MTDVRRIIKRDISDATKKAVLAEAIGCHYCTDVKVPLQVDHYVPLSRGGSNAKDNLVAACISCNSQKRAMLFHEWRLYRQTHGMPWPPLASYATDPRHYGDCCEQCSDIYYDSGIKDFSVSLSCVPDELRLKPNNFGFTCYYRCPQDHRWTCNYAPATHYFSDCPCDWCQVARDDNGDKTYKIIRYSDPDSPARELINALIGPRPKRGWEPIDVSHVIRSRRVDLSPWLGE